MSTAYDLTATVTLPDLDDGAEAANGPGPQEPWSPPCASSGIGGAMCAPPVQTLSAPARENACAGFGEIDTSVESSPTMPTGEAYPGNLLADILEYRRMRARVLGGTTLPEAQEGRYAELQTLLCASESQDRGHGRAYHRFDIRVPATLRVAEGRTVRATAVGVDNISAGGVRLEGAKARAAGERVELLMDAGQGRTVVLPARVAWMRGSSVGLMFAGAARWR